MDLVRKFLVSQKGQSIVEYAYLLLFVALTSIMALTFFGINVFSLIDGAVRRMFN